MRTITMNATVTAGHQVSPDKSKLAEVKRCRLRGLTVTPAASSYEIRYWCLVHVGKFEKAIVILD